MMQNVINTAFDGAATTAAGVELLEAFSSLAKRDSIKRCVEKKSAEVFQTFAQELGHVKSTFDKLKGSPPLIHRDHPRFAGGALWAKSLHARITKQWEMLDAARSFLAPSREAEDAASLYAQLEAALHEYNLRRLYSDWVTPQPPTIPTAPTPHPPLLRYIRRLYSDWIATVESGLARFLDNFLMVRSATPLPGATARERYGFLEQNFDRSLLQLFSEVHCWARLE